MVPLWPFLLLLTADAAPPKTACVAADVGNVRVLAGDTEDIVARLRIGTRVFVREKKGEWSRIEANAARGWMKGTLLSDDCVTIEELVAKSAAAATPADAVRWADRALALDPFAADAQAAAVAAYQRAKIGGVKAIALKELREGKTAVFLASCLDGEAILVAQAKPSGLEAFLTTTELLPPPTELATLLAALSGTTWFSLGPDGMASKVEGTPFPSPAVAEGGDGLAHVKLGACTAPGTLYATRSITAARGVPLLEESAAKAQEAWQFRAAIAGTAGDMTPTSFAAELFAGEDIRDQGLGTARIELPQGNAWALLQGSAVVESVSRVAHATIATTSDGRRIAVVAHTVTDRAEGDGRRFTVIVIAPDRSRERMDLALEWGEAP